MSSELLNDLTQQELKSGQFPHQLFLFNMVGNHILLTVITASNSTMPQLALLIPAISIILTSIILLKGRTLVNSESMFVRCHWTLVVKRTKIFLIGYAALAVAVGLGSLMYFYAGVMKEMAMAMVGGLGILPVMALVLILTVMESETLNHALHGVTPDAIKKKLLAQVAVKAEQ